MEQALIFSKQTYQEKSNAVVLKNLHQAIFISEKVMSTLLMRELFSSDQPF